MKVYLEVRKNAAKPKQRGGLKVTQPRHRDSSVIVADKAEAFESKKLKGQIYIVCGHDKHGLIKRQCFKTGQTIIRKHYGKYYWSHPSFVKPIHVRPFGKNRYEVVTYDT